MMNPADRQKLQSARADGMCFAQVHLDMLDVTHPGEAINFNVVWDLGAATYRDSAVRYDYYLDGLPWITDVTYSNGSLTLYGLGQHEFRVVVYIPRLAGVCNVYSAVQVEVQMPISVIAFNLYASAGNIEEGETIGFGIDWQGGQELIGGEDYYYFDWGDGSAEYIYPEQLEQIGVPGFPSFPGTRHTFRKAGTYLPGVQLYLHTYGKLVSAKSDTTIVVAPGVSSETPEIELVLSPSSVVVGQDVTATVGFKSGNGLRTAKCGQLAIPPCDAYFWQSKMGDAWQAIPGEYADKRVYSYDKAGVYRIGVKVSMYDWSAPLYAYADVTVTGNVKLPLTKPPTTGTSNEMLMVAGGAVLLLASLALTFANKGEGSGE